MFIKGCNYAVRFDLVKYFQLVEEKDIDGIKYYSVNAATEDGSFCLESFTTVELARKYLHKTVDELNEKKSYGEV